jgi:hypothetical protein
MTRFAQIAAVSMILLGLAANENAAAQSVGEATDGENRISQQADDNLATDDESARAEVGRQMSGAASSHGSWARYKVAGATNDFAILKVPTFRLPNGVAIQASGNFSPGKGVTCVSLCRH